MSKRVEMLHSVTGAVMSVPDALVAQYEKIGHKIAQPKSAKKTTAKTNKKKEE